MSREQLVLRQAVDAIRAGQRHRTDLGDVEALAGSIRRLGMLEPIVITPDGELVLGARRLAAVKLLGWREVPVWIVPAVTDRLRILRAVVDDHEHTKQLNPVEQAGLYAELKELYTAYARARQEGSRFGGEPGPGESPEPGEARVLAARALTGRDSHQAHERVLRVRRLAEDPTLPDSLREEARAALERMVSSGTITGPFSDVVAAEAREVLSAVLSVPGSPAAAGTHASRALAGLDAASTPVERIRRASETLAAARTGGWADIDPAFRADAALRRLRAGLERAGRWWEELDGSLPAELPEEITDALRQYHASLTAFLAGLNLGAGDEGAPPSHL